jgi:RNA polymerase sigma-70 factor (ECF subfamily)
MKMASRDVQSLFRAGVNSGLSDGQLLSRFVGERDEAAFEALVLRHGPMVWGVCRRILRDVHDAADAFQATFLVLARNCSAIAHRELVASWLHGVARQTAINARKAAAKRRARETQVTNMPEPHAVSRDHGDDELGLYLDEELKRLPEKYRAPIVLCDLEGLTHQEAARQLGWPIGTVSGRLSRARARLAKRLIQRGLGVTAGSLWTVLADRTTSAAVPPFLVGSTVRAATAVSLGQGVISGLVAPHVATVAKGVLTTMTFAKLGAVTSVVLVAGVLGAALAESPSAPPPGEGPPGNDAQATRKAVPQATSDEQNLQGAWIAVSGKVADQELQYFYPRRQPVVVNGKEMTLYNGRNARKVLTFKSRVIRVDRRKNATARGASRIRQGQQAECGRVVGSLREPSSATCLQISRDWS